MDMFNCKQRTPNSVEFSATEIRKDNRSKVVGIKESSGIIATLRVKDFDLRKVTRFARACAYADMHPANEAQTASTWKGKHRGSCAGKGFDRKNRKTHAERRAAIVSRSISKR